MEQDQLDQSSPPTKLDTSVFRAGYDARDTDVFIAVMGMTGVGKSTLISLLTTEDAKPTVGGGLSSCTKDVEVFRYDCSDTRTVYLIDTPGFDDTSLSEVEILRTLAAWLAATYGAQIRLHGVLYLHRITDVRLGGAAKRSLRMFQELCGSDELRNVILATTMWNQVAPEDGVRREAELMETQDFWGCMLERGSRVERHTGDALSAQRLLGMFLEPDRRDGPTEMALAIQKEIVDDGMNLQETRAANEVLDTMDERLQRYRKEIEDLKQDMRRAKEKRDVEWQKEIEDHFNEMRHCSEEIERTGKELVTNMEQLIQGEFEDNTVESAEKKEKRVTEQYKETRKDRAGHPNSRRPGPMVCETPFSESVDKILQRGPTDPIERPDLPTNMSEGQMPRPTSVTSSQFSLLRFQRTAHARRPVGSHWPKRARRDISLSLRGHHCSFTGPVHSKSYLPQATLNILVGLESSRNIRMKRIVLGEGPAYYAHYHEGTLRTKCYYSGSVKARYPSLLDFLHENGNLSCPQSISLGPTGSYFIRVDGRRSFRCHPNAAIDEKAERAARLWWGVDGAYVLEFETTGQLEWDLRGSYSELEEILKTHHAEKRVWELAMNIEDKCSFAVVFDDGSAFHDGKDDIICSMFDEYANKHFGDVWDVTNA